MSRRDRRREAAEPAKPAEQPAPLDVAEDILHVDVSEPGAVLIDPEQPAPIESMPEFAVDVRRDVHVYVVRSGLTTCRVHVSAVNANGKRYEVGDVADFIADDIASLPHHLIPV